MERPCITVLRDAGSFFICIFYKFHSFRNFMQTTERKHFGNLGNLGNLRNLKNLKNLKNYGSPTLRTLRFGRVNSKFGSFSTFSHRILGRFTTRFPMPSHSQTDVKPFSIHSQSILVLISIQSTIYKYLILQFYFKNKYINFRYMYQLQKSYKCWI